MTTVESLLPHQRALVEQYRSATPPRVAALEGPVGAGKTHVLAVIAAERAAAGGLVIVVVPPVLVPLWAYQIRDTGFPDAVVYASPSEFRLAYDKGATPWPESGLVICGSSIVRTSLATRTLMSASPALLVVDDVYVSEASALGSALRALAERAQHVIFTVIPTGVRANAWYPPFETIRWRFPLFDNQGKQIPPPISYRVREYIADQTEAQVVREAIELLHQVDYPLPDLLLTRTAIQFALLRLARRLESPRQLPPLEEGQKESEAEQAWSPAFDQRAVETTWKLLDRFDDLPPDRRLLAATEEARSALEEGRPLIIFTDLAQEVDYLAAAITFPQISISTVTGRTPPEERFATIEKLRNGGALVITSAAFAATEGRLPNGTRSIWFMPPRTQHQIQRRLGLGISSFGVEIVLLRAVPPVTPADQLVDRLEILLQNPWLEDPGLVED